MKRFAIILLLFLLIPSGCKRKAPKTILIPESSPLVVSVYMMKKDYETDEIAAEKKYKDKLIRIIGKAQAAETTPGNAFITLQSTNPSLLVKCSFDDDQLNELANLKEGEGLVIEGMCQGKYANAFVKQCKIIPY